MRSQLTWHDVQKLERSYRKPSRQGHAWTQKLNQAWQALVAELAFSDEPHVWQSQDDEGTVLWNAYDPRTGRSVQKLTATDLRVWLEERHYEQPLRY